MQILELLFLFTSISLFLPELHFLLPLERKTGHFDARIKYESTPSAFWNVPGGPQGGSII